MSRENLLLETAQSQFDVLYNKFSAMAPADIERPKRKNNCLTATDWVAKILFALPQSFQWGRMVFAVAQLLEEKSPLIPAFILDSTPPELVLATGYLMNFIVPLALVGLKQTVAAATLLAKEFQPAQRCGENFKNIVTWPLSLFYIACGVIFYWPVVGQPEELSNQSYTEWADIYTLVDTNAALDLASKVSFGAATALIMGPSGFNLAKMTMDMVSHYLSNDATQEANRVSDKLRSVLSKPELKYWFESVRSQYVCDSTRDLSAFLDEKLNGATSAELAFAALYGYSRSQGISHGLYGVLGQFITFVLNYGFIPFILTAFRDMNPVLALAATLTNFVLTCFLSNEIIGWMKNISTKGMQFGQGATVASMAVFTVVILYFSSLIYAPEAFKEKLAECGYADNITEITLSNNQTIPCPDNSQMWFGIQFGLMMANPTLFNFALMLMLLVPFYYSISECFSKRCGGAYTDSFEWMKANKAAKKKLTGALDDPFLKGVIQAMLSPSQDRRVGELLCSIVHRNQMRVYNRSSPATAGKVFKKIVGQSVILPTGFEDTAPFQTRAWTYATNTLQLSLLGAAFAYFWLSYDGSTGISDVPRLPNLDNPQQVAVVLSLTWLASVVPQCINVGRLGCQRQPGLSIYKDKSSRLCGKVDGDIEYVRPIFAKCAYAVLAMVFSLLAAVPLIFNYQQAVMLLEANIELDLLDQGKGPQEVVAVGFQLLLLFALMLITESTIQNTLSAILSASCHPSVAPGDDDFSGVGMTDRAQRAGSVTAVK